jgi:8-oxo-dGTP diphosphatase
MGHIHEGVGEYDTTVSAFIIRLHDGNPQVLLHNHRKLQKLFQPGGHVELKETPWEAITHEIAEETGYTLSQLKIFQPPYFTIKNLSLGVVHPTPICLSSHGFEEIWPNHFHTDIAYAFFTEELPANKPEDGESTDFLWLTLEDIEKLDSSKITDNIRILCQHVLTVFYREWQLVPTEIFNHQPLQRKTH